MIFTCLLLPFLWTSVAEAARGSEDCKDNDFNCHDWVAADNSGCFRSGYIREACLRSCGACRFLPRSEFVGCLEGHNNTFRI